MRVRRGGVNGIRVELQEFVEWGSWIFRDSRNMRNYGGSVSSKDGVENDDD